MKTSIAKLALGLAIVSISSVSSIALAAGQGGITNTKHNLGGTQNFGRNGPLKPFGWNFTNATTEICVFCHTPHGSDSSAAVPLWNRTLSTATYQTCSDLGTATMDADSAPIGGVSLACLSCHDGTQALNSVLNSPGSGSSGDINLDGNGNKIIADGYSFVNPKVCAEADSSDCGGFREFGILSDSVPSAEPIYLSTDLRNDHPVSIQYAGATTGAAKDPDFKAATSTTAGNGATVWYVETGVSAGKSKSDFPLYARTGGGALNGEPLVECATCHDPHANSATFLRLPNNNGSAVCLACHTK